MIIGLNSHKGQNGKLNSEKIRYIKRLQGYLKKLGYLGATPDGFFGNNTETAVKMFQEERGLVKDGVVGPATWKTLFKLVPLPGNLSAEFYDAIRGPEKKLFTSLNQSQVEGISLKASVFKEYNLSIQEAAYLMATSYHETGRKMQPVTEISKGSGKKYGKRLKMNGTPYSATLPIYYGRGDVQLTWYENYDRMGKRLGINLLENPDLALMTGVSAKVLVVGTTEGYFGRNLGSFITSEGTVDYFNARRCVNLLDMAEEIAEYAMKFELAYLE